jgi:hypothetical protein
MAIIALVRLFSRFRKPAAETTRLIADSAILRGVSRELTAVRRARDDGGWTPALAGRALAAIRIIAAYALDRRVGHMPAGKEGIVEDGRIILTAGWPRGKRIAVSGAVTPQVVSRALADDSNANRQPLLTSLQEALSSLTTAEFGREDKLDDAALDQALATGNQALRQVRIRQLWVMKKLATWRAGAAVDNRAWSR